jgi:hypothetical protein
MMLLYAYQRIMEQRQVFRSFHGALSPHLSGSSFALAIDIIIPTYAYEISRLLGYTRKSSSAYARAFFP